MKIFSYKRQFITFIVMLIIGMLFNPMNMLAFRFSDLYISLSLFYTGLLMASNMIWGHEIVHFLTTGHYNITLFITGILFTLISVYLLRNQIFVNDKNWLKRMIPHHSIALTTTNKLIEKDVYMKKNPKLYRLAKDIVYNQEREILFMKSML